MSRILIVDDDEDIKELIGTMLAREGYETAAAGNGQEALDYLRSGAPRPDLILLDLMMPVMNGWEFRKIQAADPDLSKIPVAVVTAIAGNAANGKDMDLGAVEIFEKPSRIWDLMEIVRRLTP